LFIDENLSQTFFPGPKSGGFKRQHHKHDKTVKLDSHLQRTKGKLYSNILSYL
jgi:hypothetical protein